MAKALLLENIHPDAAQSLRRVLDGTEQAHAAVVIGKSVAAQRDGAALGPHELREHRVLRRGEAVKVVDIHMRVREVLRMLRQQVCISPKNVYRRSGRWALKSLM